jgi:signal transduction histidine kinase
LLTGFHYVAIVLAAVGFGYRIGVGAAVVVGFVHITVGMIVCGRSLSQQGEAAIFIMLGLLAGFVTRYASTRANSRFARPSLAAIGQHQQGERSRWPEGVGTIQLSPGFAQTVRSPLAAIESAGYVLEEAALTAESRREVAAIILKECHRLDVLIRSLKFVQPQSPAYREVMLFSLIREIVRVASPVTDAASIRLRNVEGLDLKLVCDPDLIEQALLNLVTNAIRVVGQGEEIVLSAHANKGNAIIAVSHRRAGVLGSIKIPLAVSTEGERQ